MRVVVHHGIGDLASDLAEIPVEFARKAPGVVAKNAREGNKIAQRLAKERSGPHGKNYFKRLSAEATGPLSWEYGPHDGGTPVGAGYRTDGPNTDLPTSADLIGPKLGKDMGDLLDGLFWP